MILGDSGYPLRDWLLTITKDQGVAEDLYNEALIKTRSLIERSFGSWKKRFYCLTTTLRVRDMALASKIIVCCAILHNLAIQSGDNGDDLPDNPDAVYCGPSDDNADDDQPPAGDANRDKRRNEIISFFRR